MSKANPTNHARFTACRDNQTSANACINVSFNGEFTYCRCKHYKIKSRNYHSWRTNNKKSHGFFEIQRIQLEATAAERKKEYACMKIDVLYIYKTIEKRIF